MRVMVVGVLCILACVVLGLIGHQLIHFWGALVLLGVGWNFLFVGGTVLLTQSYRSSERFTAQAANDLAMFGAQALASLSAGTVLYHAGWETLNLIGLPILLMTLGAILSLRHRMTLAPSKA